MTTPCWRRLAYVCVALSSASCAQVDHATNCEGELLVNSLITTAFSGESRRESMRCLEHHVSAHPELVRRICQRNESSSSTSLTPGNSRLQALLWKHANLSHVRLAADLIGIDPDPTCPVIWSEIDGEYLPILGLRLYSSRMRPVSGGPLLLLKAPGPENAVQRSKVPWSTVSAWHEVDLFHECYRWIVDNEPDCLLARCCKSQDPDYFAAISTLCENRGYPLMSVLIWNKFEEHEGSASPGAICNWILANAARIRKGLLQRASAGVAVNELQRGWALLRTSGEFGKEANEMIRRYDEVVSIASSALGGTASLMELLLQWRCGGEYLMRSVKDLKIAELQEGDIVRQLLALEVKSPGCLLRYQNDALPTRTCIALDPDDDRTYRIVTRGEVVREIIRIARNERK